MKKIIILLILIVSIYGANEYKINTTCKKCHPAIYNEFYNSAHKQSSIYEDSIHKAIWDKHPLSKKEQYNCAKCHTPTDLKRLEKNKKHQPMPMQNNIYAQDGISCIYCHSIKDIKKSHPSNNNILNDNLNSKRPTMYAMSKKNRDKKIIFKEEKHFFGMFKTITGSPYHNIDYTNKNIYNGKICMGCHQHKENSHQFKICDVSNSGANNETKNCITCHMPKVQGTATTIKITKQHTFHGFSGARFNYKMLAKYIKIDLKKVDDGFDIIITNEAPHNFLLHPLRVAMLKISVDGKNLQPRAFVRILGKNNKPAMPWVATGLFKNNMIKANETRRIHYKYSLKEHSNIKVKFGYFLVNPKMIKKLGLQNNKSIQEFKIIKNKYFTL